MKRGGLYSEARCHGIYILRGVEDTLVEPDVQQIHSGWSTKED